MDNDVIDSLRKALSDGIQEDDIEKVIPILIQKSFITKGNWIGPYSLLINKKLAISWVILKPDQAMVYVNFEREKIWNSQSVNWKQIALDNLKELSNQVPYTHEKKDNDGNLIYVVAMQNDGLGTSRLFLTNYWKKLFPQGYYFAAPERSCGFIINKNIGINDKKETLQLINNCYRNGTSPIIDGFINEEEMKELFA